MISLIRDATSSLVGIVDGSMSNHWESNEISELRKIISDCAHFGILTNLNEKKCAKSRWFFYRPGRLNPRWEWPDSRCRDGRGQFEMISRIRDATVSLMLSTACFYNFWQKDSMFFFVVASRVFENLKIPILQSNKSTRYEPIVLFKNNHK